MAVTPNSVVTLQTPKLDLVQFSTADAAATYKTLATGGVNGTKISGVWASNSDSTAHNIFLGVQRSGGPQQTFIATTLPISAGFSNGVPPVNLMSSTVWPGLPVDSDGNPFILLQSTADLLLAQYSLTFVAGGLINVGAVRGDF
jgi:hypothetical protein